MSDLMHCSVVTPESSLFESEAKFVVVPAISGEMGIYAKHAPTVTTLSCGTIRITVEDGNEKIIAVSGGFAETDGKSVIVLADRAIDVEDVVVETVKTEFDQLETEIAAMAADDPKVAFKKCELEWRKFLLDLKEKYKKAI